MDLNKRFLLCPLSIKMSYNNNRPNEPVEHSTNEQSVELLEGKNTTQKNDNKKYEYINFGQEDQMQIQGFITDKLKLTVSWFFILITGGLLRLFFHWYPHLYLKSTHREVHSIKAEKILITEKYQGKHTSYYVKELKVLTPEKVIEMEQTVNKNADKISETASYLTDNTPFKLSVPFNGGYFKEVDTLIFFTCKKLTYIWDAERNEFVKLRGLDIDVPSNIYHDGKGLTLQEEFIRRLVYGPNEIIVPEKGVLKLLFLEILNPFYIFQLFSFALWFADNYYAYATAILLMSAFGITMSIIQTKKNQKNLKSTVHTSDIATVLRRSKCDNSIKTETVTTDKLVPGDILEIPPHGCILQCDAVLLTGNCILNEAMLTGESVPVIKTPMPNSENIIFDSKEHARHTLFCGTKVIQTRYLGDRKVLAIVIRTGFSTSKGGLVRSILYPPPVDFRFEKDSYKFVEFLACIASIGFIYTVITKALRGVSTSELIIEALDLITIVVPPALPAAMTVGRMYAQQRLRNDNIFCISPRTINVSGSIDCVCFDKTGTLTEDGLDMLCVVPIFSKYFQIPIKDISNMIYDKFIFGMVTCHSLTIIDGQLSGDPLDLKMFQSTNWILEEPDVSDNTKFDIIFPTIVKPPKNFRNKYNYLTKKNNVLLNAVINCGTENNDKPYTHYEGSNGFDILKDVTGDGFALEIGILREFPFSSSLQRMSVIVRRLGAPNFEYFCKGSPEMILTLVKEESVPENFHTVLETYTQQGYRVIALAYKELFRMTYAKVQRISLDKIETDLELLGFIVLENRLKAETNVIIEKLNEAKIRTIMVTGDNILTALSVARECGIIPNKKSVITVNAFTDDLNRNPKIYYTLTNNSNLTCMKTRPVSEILTPNGVGGDYSILSTEADSSSVTSMATIESCTVNTEPVNSVRIDINLQQKNTSAKAAKLNYNDYCFAMNGKSWAIVKQHYPYLIQKFVTRGVVFARMSPEQKQSLIQELQGLGYYVAMVGDGANDVGALRASHCGISLSDTESSVASPFTSKNPNITAIYNVICQGRAALVTSFSIFKYMAAYSLTQFISVMLLYTIESNLTDFEFLYIDLFVITVFAYFFGKTEAYTKKLVSERPLNSLISLTPVLSLIAQIILVIIFQALPFYHLRMQNWYVEFDAGGKDHKDSVGCVENYTIFTVSSFQYIILAVVFSKGKPYRKPIWTNFGFIISAIALCIFSTYLAISPCSFLIKYFELVLPSDNITINNNNSINGSLSFDDEFSVQNYNNDGNLSFSNATRNYNSSPIYTTEEILYTQSQFKNNLHFSPTEFTYVLLIYAAVNCILAFLFEYFFIDYIIFKKLRTRFHNVSKSKKLFLQIEKELNDDRKWPPLSDNYAFSTTHRRSSCDTAMNTQVLTVETTEVFHDENKILECFFEIDNSNMQQSVQIEKENEQPSDQSKIHSVNVDILSNPDNETYSHIKADYLEQKESDLEKCNFSKQESNEMFTTNIPDILNGKYLTEKSSVANKSNSENDNNYKHSMLEMSILDS